MQGHGGDLGGCGLGVARGGGLLGEIDRADLITSLSKMGRSHWNVLKNYLY